MKQIILKELDETIGDFLVKNKDVVYSAILESISEVYLNDKIKDLDVLEIDSSAEKTYITLNRSQWIRALTQAIEFFERSDIEEYEKCAKCVNIINHLKECK